jgi:hypothetical protein
MKSWMKKKWLIGAGVIALIILVVGITVPILAASGDDNTAGANGNSYFDGPTMSRMAGVLGLSTADLSSELESGKTLASLAQEHNVTTTALEDAIIAPYADQVASRVKYGYLTQEQADTFMANAREHASSLFQLDLSNASEDDHGYFDDCYDFMSANGYGFGEGWGGMMGPGMMYGWGDESNNTNDSSNNYSGGFQNRGYGGFGMMGGGMMGSW